MNDARAFLEKNKLDSCAVFVEVVVELDGEGEEVVLTPIDNVYDVMEDLAESPGGKDAVADDGSMNCDAGSL